MADTHIYFASTTGYGLKLRRALDLIDESVQSLTDVRNGMIQMRDGADNPADVANYAEVRIRFGFTSNEDAREAFLEIDSLHGKLTATGSTSAVQQAIAQALAKLW